MAALDAPSLPDPGRDVPGRITARTPRAIRELGGMAHLALQCARRAVRRPDYGAEFVDQFRRGLVVTFFPIVLISFALSYGPAGVQAGGFLKLFGSLDRLGAAYELIVIREFAPFLTAISVAGVAGTAMCADLGARRVREEIDALSVLGVDTVKALVVPRLLAIVSLSLLFNVFALLAGMLGAVLVVVQAHAPLGPFFNTFFAHATPLEFGASMLKATVYGAAIAIVCCYKGLNVSGGPEGVGRAVNQAVVVTFLLIGAIDYVFTQFLLATNPLLSTTR
jgi:phospholipid/cholesterol/gamma-HCH transport system permease protein